MHGEMLVRVLHRVADRKQRTHPVAHAELLVPAPVVHGIARHVFEGHVGRAVRVDAAVHQARECLVIEVREDVALGVENGGEPGIAPVGRQHVQRHARVRSHRGRHRLEDDAGRLAEQFADEPVAAELAPRLRLGHAMQP